jgi:U32 family peptidase
MAKEKMKKVGEIIHYFGQISVGVVRATEGTLKTSDQVKIKGSTTDLEQKVGSLQIDKKEVKEIKKGQEAGMKVEDRVREGDTVYLL